MKQLFDVVDIVNGGMAGASLPLLLTAIVLLKYLCRANKKVYNAYETRI